LAEVDAKGKIRLKVRLYKYARTSTARILGLHDGGNGCLSSFIPTFKKDTDKFRAPGATCPVIVIYDNDSGAKPIRNVVKAASKVTVKGTEPFVHVVRNLYALPTPLIGAVKVSKIEDFFDAATTKTILGGKSFNPDDKTFDKEVHYGKKVFAYKV